MARVWILLEILLFITTVVTTLLAFFALGQADDLKGLYWIACALAAGMGWVRTTDSREGAR